MGATMRTFSPTYRLAALVLAFSFALGAALPAFCQQGGGAMPAHSHADGHPNVPCEGACHAGEQPAKLLSAAVMPEAERSPTGPMTLPATAAVRVASAGAPLAGKRSNPRVARAGPPPSGRPVRLHVYHAVFLN